HGEGEAAQRHHVDRVAQKAQHGQRRQDGERMEMQTIRVLRQLPRKSRIISPVRPAAITASRITPAIEARTKTDWSASAVTFSSCVTFARMRGSAALTAFTMASVEAFPFRVTVIRTPRAPLVRTILFCTEKPSRTCATSFM